MKMGGVSYLVVVRPVIRSGHLNVKEGGGGHERDGLQQCKQIRSRVTLYLLM